MAADTNTHRTPFQMFKHYVGLLIQRYHKLPIYGKVRGFTGYYPTVGMF